MSAPRRFRVFLNPRSGSGHHTAERIRTLFEDRDCSCGITPVTKSLNMEALAATDANETVWVAAGGDGTINAVAGAIAGTSRTMAVLPCGTLNHFAQDLGIPAELEPAIDLAVSGSIRFVDAAEVNGQVFVNNSSLGFYPSIVTERDKMRKRGINRWWSLAVASMRAFVRFPRIRVSVKVAGEEHQCRAALLFVGNNEYQLQGGNAGKRACMDSGLLSLCMVPHASRVGMLRLVAASLAGRTPAVHELACSQAQEFIVSSSKRRLRVAFDGEVRRMSMPLHYRTRPGALRVIAPDRGTH